MQISDSQTNWFIQFINAADQKKISKTKIENEAQFSPGSTIFPDKIGSALFLFFFWFYCFFFRHSINREFSLLSMFKEHWKESNTKQQINRKRKFDTTDHDNFVRVIQLPIHIHHYHLKKHQSSSVSFAVNWIQWPSCIIGEELKIKQKKFKRYTQVDKCLKKKVTQFSVWMIEKQFYFQHLDVMLMLSWEKIHIVFFPFGFVHYDTYVFFWKNEKWCIGGKKILNRKRGKNTHIPLNW